MRYMMKEKLFAWGDDFTFKWSIRHVTLTGNTRSCIS